MDVSLHTLRVCSDRGATATAAAAQSGLLTLGSTAGYHPGRRAFRPAWRGGTHDCRGAMPVNTPVPMAHGIPAVTFHSAVALRAAGQLAPAHRALATRPAACTPAVTSPTTTRRVAAGSPEHHINEHRIDRQTPGSRTAESAITQRGWL